MRRIPVLVAGAVGLVCAAYTVIYLVRWEWNRALIAAVFFLAVEILLVGAVVLERLRRLESKVDSLHATPPTDPTLDTLQATAPDPPDRFGWIRGQADRTNVFLPVLLGAGVVASALAWAVEHLARATLSPSLERRLAAQLRALAPPADGLLGRPVPRLPPGRVARRRVRAAGLVVALAIAGLATGAGIDYLADRTQTRPVVRSADTTTTVEVRVFGTVADRNPERAFGHLWATCTAPGVLPGRGIQQGKVAHLEPGLFRVHVDFDIGANYEERLRGCLHDATIERVQAQVVSITAGS